ncbi:MAG TPA: ABC transporter ATP-binding protein [Bdellovibrionales bacterium]|nr:ABC transporter ATP-binding protein [Bdellovibrionales bacterium]
MVQGARLQLEGLEKEFRESGAVVAPLDLKIESGEFVSFLGPSGSGKSTLLRILAGLDAPTRGRLSIDSFGSQFFKSFVFQEAALIPWRTALENVALPLELMGRSKTEACEAAKSALRRVHLPEAFNLYPSQLSGGMKMRCSVARALVAEPRLLLLDEPFAALDEKTRQHLQEDIRKLWIESKMTVIFVTHSVSEAVFVSDRAIVFSSRPARVISDSRIALPARREGSLRFEADYLKEVVRISEAFQ